MTMQTQEQMRELDAWICEHAMGFKRVKHPWEIITNTFAVSNDGVIYILEEFNRVKPFHPTTDPAAAMEVLRKCCERIQTTVEVFYLRGIGWTLQTSNPQKPHELIKCVAETLETAICLFAKEVHSK